MRGSLWAAGAISFAINILMLTGPLFMLQVYDRVLASGSVPTLTALFLLVVALYLFMGLFDFLRTRVLSRLGYWLDARLGAPGAVGNSRGRFRNGRAMFSDHP
jgi:ABC-type protease/lipase transport system fused ATPase/permease subunit